MNWKQLHSWFNNTNQKLKKSSDGVGAKSDAPGKLAAHLFKLLDKRTRRLQHAEIWQKRNKAELDIAIKAELKKRAHARAKLQASGNGESDSDTSDSNSNSSSDDNSDSEDDDAAAGPSKGKARVKMDKQAKSEWLSVRRRLSVQMWNAQEGEEREAILKIYDEQELPGSKGSKGDADDDAEKTVAERTPEELQG